VVIGGYYTVIIAEHPELGITVEATRACPSNDAVTIFNVPRKHFQTALEICENKLELHITKCTAFDNYIGVHSHAVGSLAHCRYALERLFTRLAKERTLALYLRDKGFRMTIYANMGNCFLGEVLVFDG